LKSPTLGFPNKPVQKWEIVSSQIKKGEEARRGYKIDRQKPAQQKPRKKGAIYGPPARGKKKKDRGGRLGV